MINFKELTANFRKFSKFRIFKYVKPARRFIAWIIIGILAFSGFLRFVELNTECDNFNNYYEFQNSYCNYSGFLNHKVKCEIPVGVDINCNCDLGIFSFPVVKTKGNMPYGYEPISGEPDYNFTLNESLNFSSFD